MADVPGNLKYTKEHEWVRKEADGKLVIGVTAHAQESLGDVVYVELPKVGTTITAGQSFGVIESTKAVSELYAPVTGKVLKVNDELTNEPTRVNEEPYGAGWILEVQPNDPAAYDALLDAAAYTAVAEESK